jgi:hypothetical protein
VRGILGRVALVAALVATSACSSRDILDAVDKPKETKAFMTEIQAALRKAGVVQINQLGGNTVRAEIDPKLGLAWADYSKNPITSSLELTPPGQQKVLMLFPAPGSSYIKTDAGEPWVKVVPGVAATKGLEATTTEGRLNADPVTSLGLTPALKTGDSFRQQGPQKLGSEELSVWEAPLTSGARSPLWKVIVDEAQAKLDPKGKDTVQVWLDDKQFPRAVAEMHGGQLLGFALKPAAAGDHFKVPTGKDVITP